MEKKKILVTDDHPGVRESFRMMLKDSYEVLTADCGSSCLRMVKHRQPQLVFLDVQMPDMNGLEVFRAIKQLNCALPVIMITGVGTHKIAIEALRLGAVDFIAKPINFYSLRSIIANVLAQQDKEQNTVSSSEDLITNLITKNYLSTLKMLNKVLEAKDPYTREHSKRVSDYSVKMAQELGLSGDEQEVMRQTALLHDIGKVGIDESILNKRAKLNAQEWTEIQRHTLIGQDILEPLKVLRIEQSMIRHHHERYDGKGYPDRLKGEEIPLYARILAVADAFDSMVNQRAYRGPLSPIEALTEIERCSGSQFDPKIIKAFVKMLKEDKTLINHKTNHHIMAKQE